MADVIKVRTKCGYFLATASEDSEYPGIDVEFIHDNDDGDILSRPRVLFEYPNGDESGLRLLVWDDKDSEDYSREIEFDI